MGEQLDDNNGAISPYPSRSEIVCLFGDCGFTAPLGISLSRTQVALEGLGKLRDTTRFLLSFDKTTEVL